MTGIMTVMNRCVRSETIMIFETPRTSISQEFSPPRISSHFDGSLPDGPCTKSTVRRIRCALRTGQTAYPRCFERSLGQIPRSIRTRRIYTHFGIASWIASAAAASFLFYYTLSPRVIRFSIRPESCITKLWRGVVTVCVIFDS